MTTTALPTAVDRAVAAFVAGDAGGVAAACAADVLADVSVPHWRFQLRGRDALRALLADDEFLPGRRVTATHVTPTETGALLEIESWAPLHGEDRMWRELVQFVAEDGEVRLFVAFCTGIWDAATIARQAAEAPIVVRR